MTSSSTTATMLSTGVVGRDCASSEGGNAASSRPATMAMPGMRCSRRREDGIRCSKVGVMRNVMGRVGSGSVGRVGSVPERGTTVAKRAQGGAWQGSARIAKNSTLQQFLGPAAKGSEAFQFDLEVQAVVLVAFAVADVVAGQRAHRHAAVFPLHTGEGLERGAVLQRVVPATDQPPALADRRDEADVGLLQLVAAEAV